MKTNLTVLYLLVVVVVVALLMFAVLNIAALAIVYQATVNII